MASGGRRNGKHRNQKPMHHSTRLISEDAARSTTQFFLDVFDSSNGRQNPARPRDDGEDPLWKDAQELLAAEHALEFWAHSRGRSRKNKADEAALEESAETALRLFEALHHFHLRRGHVLNNAMYSHVIDALAKSPSIGHVYEADALLRQFISLYVKHHTTSNEEMDLTSVLEMIESHSQSFDDGRAEKFSSRQQPGSASTSLTMPDDILWSDKDSHHFPNQIRITGGVMRGYACQSHPRGAESLLDLMIALSSSGQNRRLFCPNERSFAIVVDAYSRMHDGPNAQRVLQLMKRRSFRTGAPVDDDVLKNKGMKAINSANVVAYNAAISAWARSTKGPPSNDGAPVDTSSPGALSSSRAAAECAERLLREMWDEYERREEYAANSKRGMYSAILPDVVTYVSVISAYASCLDQPYGLRRARELLTELEGLAAQQLNGSFQDSNVGVNHSGRNAQGFQPNAFVYSTLLQAYSSAGDAVAAETLLQSLISTSASPSKEGARVHHRNIQPNTRMLNVALNAWSKRGGGDGGFRANQLLERFEDLASSGKELVTPDIISYNTVLAAWSKSAGIDPSSLPEDGEGSARGSVGVGAAYRAMKLLDKIERHYTEATANNPDRRHRSAVKPDVITYNSVISAFANAAKHVESATPLAEKAETILSRAKNISGIEPDDYSYNGVLLAWARSSGGLAAAERAESILRSMKDPTIVSWSTVVNAYTHADCAKRAEALLKEIEQNADVPSGNRRRIKPSIVLYNNVLHAWGKSSVATASKNAEALLTRMEDATSKLPKPDVISYRLVLTALENTKDLDKAERAKSVLDRFLESNRGRADPNEIRNAYKSVLTACAYTPADAGEHHRDNAARIILETFSEMNQIAGFPDGDGGPDQESYALFIQGSSHLFEANAEKGTMLIKLAFRECCKKGLLNRIIWDKVISSMGPDAVKAPIEEMMSGREVRADIRFEDLPAEWCSI